MYPKAKAALNGKKNVRLIFRQKRPVAFSATEIKNWKY